MAGLLGIQFDSVTQDLSQKVFEYQLQQDPKLNDILSDIAKQKMFDDVLININFLDTALKLKDEKLFPEYSCWLFCLMVSRMTYCSKEQVAQQIQGHYEALKHVLGEHYGEEDGAFISRQLDKAIESSWQCCLHDKDYRDAKDQGYEQEVERYLQYLLDEDSNRAIGYLVELEKGGMEIPEIYVSVVQEALHRVGDMWLHDEISVAKELCCTSASQMAEAQFYAKIFATRRRNRTVIVACAGKEYHEMGARTVSDVLSYGGYTCIYLGAAVSNEYILQAMDSYKPHLVCLSATMPQTLVDCQTIIPEIKNNDPKVKIAVGGRAFEVTDEIWKKWNIDIYTKNAKELLGWSYANIG
ncbi:MAG: cobalamin-dependent protein [Bacillota bacterium]|nr:cobalamin-dependent protein [Bacillota bacterium]